MGLLSKEGMIAQMVVHDVDYPVACTFPPLPFRTQVDSISLKYVASAKCSLDAMDYQMISNCSPSIEVCNMMRGVGASSD
ncbi:hypothetical protein KIN20_018917 [Parelaphostrongylus tenuis]|uniref:Uncharacterized protein n=1 Tax=Parelaphostrongylus tenuis TaxID=148309 RepID=A0AAD5N2J5_PARTN|nr:hypothetical protein KIN20_018917 [Parelaphostrongylus tenuis]